MLKNQAQSNVRTLGIVIWLVTLCFAALFTYGFIGHGGQSWLLAVFVNAWGGVLGILAARLLRLWHARGLDIKLLLGLTFILSCFFSVAWFYPSLAFLWGSFGKGPLQLSFFTASAIGIPVMLFVSLVWALAYLSWLQLKARDQMRGAMSGLEDKLRHARIQPHFLYNSLNMIHQSIHHSPGAREAIEELADYLELVNGLDPEKLVTLADELELLRRFLLIHQLRLEPDLETHFEVDEMLLDTLVPSMILQPIAENALKYGSWKSRPYHLCIRAKRKNGNAVIIEMENPGKLKLGASEKMGVQFVRNRLERFFTQASFSLTSGDDRVYARMAIPVSR